MPRQRLNEMHLKGQIPHSNSTEIFKWNGMKTARGQSSVNEILGSMYCCRKAGAGAGSSTVAIGQEAEQYIRWGRGSGWEVGRVWGSFVVHLPKIKVGSHCRKGCKVQ